MWLVLCCTADPFPRYCAVLHHAVLCCPAPTPANHPPPPPQDPAWHEGHKVIITNKVQGTYSENLARAKFCLVLPGGACIVVRGGGGRRGGGRGQGRSGVMVRWARGSAPPPLFGKQRCTLCCTLVPYDKKERSLSCLAVPCCVHSRVSSLYCNNSVCLGSRPAREMLWYGAAVLCYAAGLLRMSCHAVTAQATVGRPVLRTPCYTAASPSSSWTT